VIKARIGSQQKERRPAAAGRRKDSVATLLAMVTENEPSEKITALFVAGRANGLIRDPGIRLAPSSAPIDTGAAWPAIKAIAISNMTAMLTISFRYWAIRCLTVFLRQQLLLN
jgi:hypothetical protein